MINAPEAFRFGTITLDASTAQFFSAASGVSAADLEKADEVYLSVETAGIRFRMDGTAPTAAIGEPLAAGARLIIIGRDNAMKLQVIGQSGSPAVSFHLLSYGRVA